MENLEDFFKVLKDKYNAGIDKDQYYKILGTGHFSLVFDVEGAAYKITTELNYKNQVALAQETNMLQQMGINVPYTYYIHQYNGHRKAFDDIKKVAEKYPYGMFVQEIEKNLNQIQYKSDIDVKNFCGIFQEKIAGDVPFAPTAYYIGEACMLSKEDVEDAMAGCELVDESVYYWVGKIQQDLNNKLDYFLNIPDEHYTKFLCDAFKIHQSQVHIDNVTKKNYIYNKDKGFYFIDIGALNYKDILLSERLYWPITCTIENVLNQVVYPVEYYSVEAKSKYLKLYAKLHRNLGNCFLQNLSNEETKENIQRYINKIKRSSDYYKMYKTFLSQTPRSISDAASREFKYVESIVKGNALASGKEHEIN